MPPRPSNLDKTIMRYPLLTRTGMFIPVAALFVACAPNKDSARSDTATAMRGIDSASGSMAKSAGMGGMKNDSMGGMGGMSAMGATTGNADQDFLRMMSDHHKGMVTMAHEVKEQKSSSVKDIATRLDTQQDNELDQMTTMLERDFKDPYAPKVMAENQKIIDALKTKTGADFDRTFLQNTIMHHQEAIKMVDGYLPHSKSAAIRKMAEKIKADQTREIGEFQQRIAQIKG